MTAKRIRGVALIVQNPEGKILVLQEYETKIHFGKICGMFSIPMETLKPGEQDCQAVSRLVNEELPGFSFPFKNSFCRHVGIYRVAKHVWANLYSVKMENFCLPNSISKEVGNHQWISPREALDLWLRQGAREMISDFIANKKGTLCKHCRVPQLR